MLRVMPSPVPNAPRLRKAVQRFSAQFSTAAWPVAAARSGLPGAQPAAAALGGGQAPGRTAPGAVSTQVAGAPGLGCKRRSRGGPPGGARARVIELALHRRTIPRVDSVTA